MIGENTIDANEIEVNAVAIEGIMVNEGVSTRGAQRQFVVDAIVREALMHDCEDLEKESLRANMRDASTGRSIHSKDWCNPQRPSIDASRASRRQCDPGKWQGC